MQVTVTLFACTIVAGNARAQGGATPAAATGRVKGTVLAEGSGEPLAGVRVAVQGTSLAAVTDARGGFVITDVPPGQAVVLARYVGREPDKLTVSVRAGETAEADFTLNASARPPIELAPVTVKAAPELPQQPLASVHVPQTVIQQTPAFDNYDLMRQAAGLEVHDQGQGPDFASDASVRGYSSDHSTDIATWVDGVPLNESVNGHAEGYDDYNLLFPEAIQDIDVIKGPTSAEYGNFAFSGIVNIRTIEQMSGSSLWLEPASFGHEGGTFLTGFGNDTTHGVFGLRGEHEDGWRPNAKYNIGQLHFRIVHDFSAKTTFDGGVEVYAMNCRSPGFLDDSQFNAQDYSNVSNPTDNGWKQRAQERASLRVLLDPSLVWRTTVYSTQGAWQLILTIPPLGSGFEGSGGQSEEDDRRVGAGLTSALSWALPHTDITVGTEELWAHSAYQNWNVTNTVRDSAAVIIDPAVQTTEALFVQATEDITSTLRATVGLRFENQSTTDTPDSVPGPGVPVFPQPALTASKSLLVPKVGLFYSLPDSLALYANVSEGFRQTDGVIEDPTLPFIKMWAYEIGVKLHAQRVSGTLALFRDDVSNEQTFDPITLNAFNGGSSTRQGAEIDFTGRVTNAVHLSADWTIQDARYTSNYVASDGTPLDGLRVYNTDKYVGVAGLEIAPPGNHWQLRLSTNAVGGYSPFDEPGVVLPGYALFHVSGGMQLGEVFLQLGVRNVFDATYREIEAGGLISPGVPRSVYASLRTNF
ncbi:MAG TPA: TonB-dependent receptor [Gemmatimonadales bacterium]|nr:TonB-dependent receptor [Gemmatimonadales bacterium]